ncbi:MAG: epoxyqueuosine reductase QueH [Candidatus Krumholzibacteriota bacterium]|nr:epoxyqueuosine reductase QueH [Candidatus Krumholzibacteriota bacterium]
MNPKTQILLHTCCASCSSYVIPHLQENFEVSAFFYNPNIYPEKEYILRLEDMKFLSGHLGVNLITGSYNTADWEKAVMPYRDLPEKSKRCWECYGIRLDETAKMAAGIGIELFTTTLSVSPHKIYKRIREAADKAAKKHGVTFYNEDFKKKDGFKISVEQSGKLKLSRQNYCGCVLSLEESREKIRKERSQKDKK